MPSKTTAIKNSTILFVYLLIVWGLYRLLVRFPEEIEDLVIKPLVWLPAVYLLVKSEKSKAESVGLTFNNLFYAVYYALILGAIFAIEGVVVNYFKYNQTLEFNANLGDRAFIYTLGLSLITAIPQELAFRGFIFSRLSYALDNEWLSTFITSIAWTLLNVPIVFFVDKLDMTSALVYLLLTFLYSIGACYVFSKTKNILAPILLHVFWEWPIILFR